MPQLSEPRKSSLYPLSVRTGRYAICFAFIAGFAFFGLYRNLQDGILKTQWLMKVLGPVNNPSNAMRKNSDSAAPQQKSKTLVLVYTTAFVKGKWITKRGPCSLKHFSGKKCPLDEFELTYDKLRFTESDLVVFHARNMPSLDHLKMLLKGRPSSQRWVFALWENPKMFSVKKTFNGLFNLTWTYRTDSDIWTPYGNYVQVSMDGDKVNKVRKQISHLTREKSKLVAWIVSNCHAKLRISFVRELQKFIKVDVFGNCSGRIFGEPRSCPKSKTRDCLQNYKFYLSFENVLCEDYITEKYWGRLGNENVVPVVMGGANYTKLAIPGSYIDVMDFKTVKQLAEYLQYLDKNDTAYNEYFKWRLKYKVFPNYIDTSLCNICKWYVSKSSSRRAKVYRELISYWVKKAKCDEKNQLIASMLSN